MSYKYLDNDGLLYFMSLIKQKFLTKVDKEHKTGSQSEYKVLTDNNFTDALKQKLDSIGAVMTYKGSVATVSDLPSTGNVIGDTYNVSSDGKNYCWNGTGWDDLGGTIDLSDYVKKTDLVAITNTEIQNDWDETT